MPMADQQRRPFRVDGLNGATANSITCRTCGCLNFSSDDECERCRNARVGDSAAASAPVVRHPFLPTSRPANGTANGSSSRPSSAAPSPRGPSPRSASSTSLASNGTRLPPDARENPNILHRGSGNGHSGRGAENSRTTSDSRRPGPPPVTSSADRAAKKEASVAPAKVIQPGSSIRAFMQPTSSATVPVVKAPTYSSVPRAPATTASAEANGSTLSAVGDKRARRVASTATDKATVVIDLISSDEEGENHRKRAAKRARQAARQRESISRLALRRVEPEEEHDGVVSRTLSPDRKVEDRIRLEPIKGRSFDCVDFNLDDFPTAIEMAQAMRVRHGVSSSNSTASSALSTPTSAASSVAPPLAARETVSTTAPTTTQVAPHKTVPPVMSMPASASNSVSLPVPPSTQATTPAAMPATAPTAATTINRTTPATSTTAAAYSTGPPVHAVSSGVTKPPTVVDPTTAANPGSIASRLPPKVSLPPSTAAPAANEASGSTASVQSVSSSAPPTPVARTPASQHPIIVDDSEDDSEEETCLGGKTPLFQSRRFQSVVFSARDFLTANDGLNLARRSSTMTPQPGSPEAKTMGVTTRTPVAHSQVSTAATTNETCEQASSGYPTSNGIKTLQARRITGGTNSTSTSLTPDPVPMQKTMIKTEHPATLVRIIKPTLGHISTDFVHFMRECIEDDDRDDDDEEALAREKLMEIVDLTNHTDESADEDDEDDYFELIETTASPELQRPTSASVPAVAESSSLNSDHAVLSKGGDGVIVENGQPQTGPVVVKRTRAPRPKETCMLCEEKAWIRALVNCPDCKKYYHKRCARDYGDDSVCWNCDADGMIDDSELTEDHTNQVVGIFGALRQSSDSEPGEDDELDDNADVANPEPSLLLHTVSTRSTRRWKEFLEVSTADMEQSFHAITNQITQELQDEATKSKYSKGFARIEDLEKGMAQVVDHYAELQEREERLQREERARAPPPETADAGGVEGTEGLLAADSVLTGGTAAQLPPTETVGSVDPLSASAPPVDPNDPFPG